MCVILYPIVLLKQEYRFLGGIVHLLPGLPFTPFISLLYLLLALLGYDPKQYILLLYQSAQVLLEKILTG